MHGRRLKNHTIWDSRAITIIIIRGIEPKEEEGRDERTAASHSFEKKLSGFDDLLKFGHVVTLRLPGLELGGFCGRLASGQRYPRP